MPAALDSKRQCDEPEWSEKMENNSNKLLKIISICLAAAVIVSAGVGVFLWKQIRGSSGEKIKIIKRTESIAEILGKDDSLGKVDIGRIDLSQDSGTVAAGNENVPIYATGRLSKYVTSVLLVVQDGHTSSKPKQADAVILFSYNEATQKISVLSMLRDCWVPVEGHGFARLADAYAIGGTGLLVNTINDYFSLDIRNYAVVGTEEMKSIIDHMGGINANLTAEEAAYLGLEEGETILNGSSAIKYALDRTSGGNGDFSRTERQRKLISAFIKEMRNHFDDEEGMIDLQKFIFADMDTNVDLKFLANLGKGVIKADEITYSPDHVPFDDCWEYAEKDGSIVISISREENNQILKEKLFGE